jgi:hypothetical protein
VVILVIAGAVAKVVTDVLTPMLGAAQGGEWIARGAGIAILVVGIFAALDQLQIAPAIVTGLFYAMLVAIVGVVVVAFGGGGISVAREYWQRWSLRAEMKGRELRREMDAEAARDELRTRIDELR